MEKLILALRTIYAQPKCNKKNMIRVGNIPTKLNQKTLIMILALKKINIIEDTKKIIKLALKIYIYADKT